MQPNGKVMGCSEAMDTATSALNKSYRIIFGKFHDFFPANTCSSCYVAELSQKKILIPLTNFPLQTIQL